MMSSPCKGCENEKKDKNQCIDNCEKIAKFQEKINRECLFFNPADFFSDGLYMACFQNGGRHNPPKPPHL